MVKLWYYQDSWHQVTDPSFFRDTPDHLVGGHIPAESSYIAVSPPESTGAVFVIATGAALLLRRRRHADQR